VLRGRPLDEWPNPPPRPPHPPTRHENVSSRLAVQNADGLLEAFVVGADGGLHHRWQTAPNTGWSGWAEPGSQRIGVLVAARDADGRLEIFTVDVDGTLRHRDHRPGEYSLYSPKCTVGTVCPNGVFRHPRCPSTCRRR
jgi:hypothetical protein